MEYKVKSDYTRLRRKKQRLSNGDDIYENNYMTISPMDDIFPDDQEIIPSSGNFRFSVRYSQNSRKRHARRDWLKTKDGNDFWTLNDVNDTAISNESFIRIKPDYTKLTDFAYYGSAVEMIRAAVNDVVLNFPAEIYFSGLEFPLNSFIGKTYYLIPNGYGINADVKDVKTENVDNPLRYLCLSAGNYDYYSQGVFKSSGVTFDITTMKAPCDEQGGIIAKCVISTGSKTFTIYTWKKGSDKWLIYEDASYNGDSIRPCQEFVDNYFNEVDDFGYVLLDRDSNPIYRATFETPIETDTGNTYTMEDYIWPSYNNWNPDVSSGTYGKYIADLVDLASYYDQYDTNNLWRMETHEAIKNLDWTFFRDNGDTTDDLSKIDSSKIEAMIQIYGRAFDGIKRYIDNIKHINNVTYNGKNNLPDYHLTDVAELSGWEAYSINPKAKSNVYCDNAYGGRSKGWSETDMNIAFMRNLKINSRYLQSLKGTRHGIEAILGLLGLKPEEYKITEHTQLFTSKKNYCDFPELYLINKSASGSSIGFITEEDVAAEERVIKKCPKFTAPLFRNVAGINKYKGGWGIDSDDTYGQDYLYGLPLKMTTYYSGDEALRYCIPWFDSKEYHYGNWYFQCKGGWGKHISKKIDMPNMTKATAITTSIGSNGFTIYDESENYLKFAQDIQEMLDFPYDKINKDDICYVTDITELGTSNASHYFILQDKAKATMLGSGWKNITNDEIMGNTTTAATKVIYLESLKEQTEGNNPHVGKGFYDDGQEYIDYMSDIFKFDKENSGLTMFSNNDQKAISDYIFSASTVTDNKKCWYFTPRVFSASKLREVKNGKKAKMSPPNEKFEGMSTYPVSFLGNPQYFVSAAYSIVNVKNLDIVFHYPCDLDTAEQSKWKDYIDNVVIEYVKQMLPSTAIWNYKVDGIAEGCSKDAPKETETFRGRAYQTTNDAFRSEYVDGVTYGNEDKDGLDSTEWFDNNIITK